MTRSGAPRYVPEDSLQSPRFTGPSTFARLPYVRTLEDVDLAVVGVPFDTGVTYRAGGRFGPNGVRAASVMLRQYNTNLDIKPFDILSCVDYGDVSIVPGYIERSYEAIERTVAPIVEAGVVPLLIGGDHACTAGDHAELVDGRGSLGTRRAENLGCRDCRGGDRLGEHLPSPRCGMALCTREFCSPIFRSIS